MGHLLGASQSKIRTFIFSTVGSPWDYLQQELNLNLIDLQWSLAGSQTEAVIKTFQKCLNCKASNEVIKLVCYRLLF